MFAASKTAAPVSAAKYIEDVFSVWLRTGTGANATITTNLDASTNKSLVWTKSRSAATDHKFTDTVRGATKALISNTTGAETTDTTGLTAFSSTGYTIGTSTTYNNSGATYVDWQFVAAPKFFDVVTYSGNSTAGRTIPHNLGSVPGCIIVKNISSGTASWEVYHRSAAAAGFTAAQSKLTLNSTAAVTDDNQAWNGTAPTSTVFSVGDGLRTNQSGSNYVAYLFAHDAGGFGAAGTDNVISCGSFTTDAGGAASVTLNYEPQWVLLKKSSAGVEDWYLFDSMRGIATGGVDAQLNPNLSAAEASTFNYINLTATGFGVVGQSSSATYIYIAIRRGPMRTPTSGTSVFYPTTYTAPALNATATVTTGFPVDSVWVGVKDAIAGKTLVQDRLRISNNTTTSNSLETDNTASETSINGYATFNIANNTGYTLVDSNGSWGGKSNTPVWTPYSWSFRRAPGFFDVVCYDGNSANRTINHNLGAVPELMIAKQRSASGASLWMVYAGDATKYLQLQSTAAATTSSLPWNDTAPTSTVFSLGTSGEVNVTGRTYVWYGFASVAGVSKVGSYTGTGTTKQIDCGFAAGARFVLIKRTDSTGDWYVWDTARGIVAGNDPYLLLNSSAAEVTNTDYVDTYSAGFEISSTAPAAINANGGTFIFLAIS